jgi:hypothetical protein
MRSVLFSEIMQCIVVIPCRHFGTTYQSNLQKYPETAVRNYHYMLRNIPEECRYHVRGSGSLKLRNFRMIRRYRHNIK